MSRYSYRPYSKSIFQFMIRKTFAKVTNTLAEVYGEVLSGIFFAALFFIIAIL